MRNGLIVDRDGRQLWYLDGKLHRDENDLPAHIWPDGSQSWYRHGQLHRDNGLPAVIYKDGSQAWYRHGKCHRENGPAIIRADGYQRWYRHGKRINVENWTKDNDITPSWETWDETTWSLFRLEFL